MYEREAEGLSIRERRTERDRDNARDRHTELCQHYMERESVWFGFRYLDGRVLIVEGLALVREWLTTGYEPFEPAPASPSTGVLRS